MKAIVQDAYGQADVLEFQDVDAPRPGPDDVLVRVHAAGVDPGVWHLMTGRPYLIRAFGFGLRRPRHRVRGEDVAGRVEAVGANVTRFKPGDEVFGSCDGSFAEYACAHQDRFALKPANLTFEQVAAVPGSAATALQALRDTARVRPGQRVLVIGAAGGVGTFAVQVAKALGAHVTGVCSAGKVELVRSIGADDIIDYTRDDCTDGTRRYDVVLVTAGNRPLSHLRRALTPRGTVVLVGAEGGGRWLGGMERLLQAALISLFARQSLRGMISTRRQDDLQFLAGLLAAGTVTPVIDRTYPLSDAADAIRYLAEGHARGKVVLTV